MVLDQQIPLEKAFGAPMELGAPRARLDPARIAAMDPERWPASSPGAGDPPLPGLNAAGVGAVPGGRRGLGGDAAAIWRTAGDGIELYRRVRALPGFGDQKARIFIGLLGKQRGVTPRGWREGPHPRRRRLDPVGRRRRRRRQPGPRPRVQTEAEGGKPGVGTNQQAGGREQEKAAARTRATGGPGAPEKARGRQAPAAARKAPG